MGELFGDLGQRTESLLGGRRRSSWAVSLRVSLPPKALDFRRNGQGEQTQKAAGGGGGQWDQQGLRPDRGGRGGDGGGGNALGPHLNHQVVVVPAGVGGLVFPECEPGLHAAPRIG